MGNTAEKNNLIIARRHQKGYPPDEELENKKSGFMAEKPIDEDWNSISKYINKPVKYEEASRDILFFSFSASVLSIREINKTLCDSNIQLPGKVLKDLTDRFNDFNRFVMNAYMTMNLSVRLVQDEGEEVKIDALHVAFVQNSEEPPYDRRQEYNVIYEFPVRFQNEVDSQVVELTDVLNGIRDLSMASNTCDESELSAALDVVGSATTVFSILDAFGANINPKWRNLIYLAVGSLKAAHSASDTGQNQDRDRDRDWVGDGINVISIITSLCKAGGLHLSLALEYISILHKVDFFELLYSSIVCEFPEPLRSMLWTPPWEEIHQEEKPKFPDDFFHYVTISLDAKNVYTPDPDRIREQAAEEYKTMGVRDKTRVHSKVIDEELIKEITEKELIKFLDEIEQVAY